MSVGVYSCTFTVADIYLTQRLSVGSGRSEIKRLEGSAGSIRAASNLGLSYISDSAQGWAI